MSNPVDLRKLPDDLPRPEDDGAARHLPGMRVPEIELRSTAGGSVNLGKIGGLAVIYIYPMTGNPETPLPDGWDKIPGARGCTPQSLMFNDVYSEIDSLGAQLFGLSSQDTDYQMEMAERLDLSFPVLSDSDLKFATALHLPTMDVAGMRLLKRLTLIARDGVIEDVFYPVFPPTTAAATVLSWLRLRSRGLETRPDLASRPAVIYSRSSCQYCKAAKELLNALKIDYQEIDIVETEGADDQMVVVSGGRRTTPQIFIAGSHIGGADDLQALADSGKLAGILGTG